MPSSNQQPATEGATPAGGVTDAVQQHFVEALAARAAQRQGRVKALLEARVEALRAGLHAPRNLPAPGTGDDNTASTLPAPSSPLADLLAHIADQAAADSADSADDGAAATHPAASATSPPELKTLRYFRNTWSRLSADQRLTQSLAQVPPNAGPLHSHHLVHRSLTLMRALSPDYLQHFMAYADALLWLAQVPGAAAAGAAGATAVRGEPAKKPARGRQG